MEKGQLIRNPQLVILKKQKHGGEGGGGGGLESAQENICADWIETPSFMCSRYRKPRTTTVSKNQIWDGLLVTSHWLGNRLLS